MGDCLRRNTWATGWRRAGRFAFFSYFALAAAPALAGEAGQIGPAAGAGSLPGLAELTLIAGLAIISGLVLLRHYASRRRFVENEAKLYRELSSLRAKLDRAGILLGSESQIIITWGEAGGEPDIEGDAGLVLDGTGPLCVLAFESWLPPSTAAALESLVGSLRERGESFCISAQSLAGTYLEISGRPAGGFAVLRIRGVSSDRLEAARLQALQASTAEQFHALRALLDAVPFPAWQRDPAGKLSWVNSAYARAVEAKSPEAAVSHGVELVESQTREASAAALGGGEVWHARAPAVVAGERHMLEIFDVPSGCGSAGIAADVSEIESLRSAIDQQTLAHARTLDKLSTAVAIFDGAKRLVFHNLAYRQLWAIDQAWLEEKPSDSEVLDRLRTARLLPEQADFRAWKAELLAAYQSLDEDEQVWFLPDGRTLRAVIGPNAQGGVTYLFDDMTERYRLASQFKTSMRVQSETLDALKEGVAVFGSDGRLKLFNPAFATILCIELEGLDGQPHIDRVAQI
ncbi:MAG: PAS-domain containing protein, partial [Beijerinckiaceae bacterium]|nr:PAS-domain containing protein [Beijerinckiaceae bacterium]